MTAWASVFWTGGVDAAEKGVTVVEILGMAKSCNQFLALALMPVTLFEPLFRSLSYI